MLYAAVILCAFLAAVTQAQAVGAAGVADVRIRYPIRWLVGLGFVYWSLSLGNGFDWIGYFRESECLRVGYCEEAFTSFEPLFTELLRISAVTDYQVVPFAAGIAACVAILTMARSKHFNNFSILFFISISAFYLYIEQVRQGMAMCLLILTLESFLSSRKKWSMLMFLSACLFHWTSLLFVIPFLLGRARAAVSALFMVITFAVFSVALSAPESIFNFLNALGLGEIDIAKKILFYAAVEEYNASAIGLGFIFDFALMLLLLAPIRGVQNGAFKLAPIVISYFAILLLSRINISVYRVSLVFVPFVCLYLSALFTQQWRGIVVAGVRFDTRVYGLMVALVILGQSSRPFTDPILRPNMLDHRIYILHGIPSAEQRNFMSEAKCDFLDNEGKGFLCGRW